MHLLTTAVLTSAVDPYMNICAVGTLAVFSLTAIMSNAWDLVFGAEK